MELGILFWFLSEGFMELHYWSGTFSALIISFQD